MKTLGSVAIWLVLLWIVRVTWAEERPQTSDRYPLEVERLADGVFAVTRTNPAGLMCDGNSLFVIGDEGVLVVDAPEASRDVLAELRKRTSKPVRYVVNTHWHDDHIIGNHVYREVFPEVEIVGSKLFADYLPTTGLENRKKMLDGAPKFVKFIKGEMAKGIDLAGAKLTNEVRVAYESDFALVDRYLAEVPGAPILLPTIPVDDRLTISLGNRTVEVRSLGRGHTAGDLVVFLPAEKIVATGDLVGWPIPLVGGEQSHVDEWGVTLDRLLALGATTFVPGHGSVRRGAESIRSLRNLFEAIRSRVRSAVEKGQTLEEARASVLLDDFEKSFAGKSPMLRFLFGMYVRGPGIESAWRSATAPPPAMTRERTVSEARTRTPKEWIDAIVVADYAGDRAALERLFSEADRFLGNPAIESRIRYWKGFARWRRALNGANERPQPTDLADDVVLATQELRRAGELDPAFVDARIGELQCLGLALFFDRNRAGNDVRIARLRALLAELNETAIDNPRFAWAWGMAFFSLPPEKGGGAENVIPRYLAVLESLRRRGSLNVGPLDPTWGEAELCVNLAYSYLHRMKPDLQEARRWVDEAIRSVPAWHYAKEILRPQIDEALCAAAIAPAP